jgi:hypothetical protein
MKIDTVEQLSKLMRSAADAHHAYEIALGRKDEDWHVFYASYIEHELAAPTCAVTGIPTPMQPLIDPNDEYHEEGEISAIADI